MRRSAPEEGERWLAQAAADLYWAKHLAREGGWHLACFLVQQVAEKALEAFLYAQGQEIVVGHSVARLCASAARYGPEFGDRVRRWSILDGYYVPTRYPSSLPDGIPADVYTKDAAADAVACVRKLLDQAATQEHKEHTAQYSTSIGAS